MIMPDIAARRLTNEHLVGKPLASPGEVVAWLGAVQAQDYPGAKWALGQRLGASSDALVDQAFNEGKILRTHVLRPTWHFVTPEDIVWLQMLTSPRVHALNKYYYNKLGINADTRKKANAALVKALAGGKQLTRTEVAAVLERAKLGQVGLRHGYLIIQAELEGLICSGAMKGKQHTFALVAERAPQAKMLTPDEALAELTKRYFTSHGPAQLQDFAWWSSLAMADIKRGIEMLGSYLTNETVGGKTYWFVPRKTTKIKPPLVHLLPNYDEYLIAYKDHTPSLDPSVTTVSIGTRNIIFANHLVVLNGLVVGGWRRVPAKDHVRVALKLIKKFAPAEQRALTEATPKMAVEYFARYGDGKDAPEQTRAIVGWLEHEINKHMPR